MSIKPLRTRLARGTSLLTVAAFALLVNSALAQERGADRLVKLHRIGAIADLQKVEAGHTLAMTCPKCKDTSIKVAQSQGKGGRREAAILQRHGCPGCDTKIVTEGVGKQAKSQAKHVCVQNGGENAGCCATKKTSNLPKGLPPQSERRH